MARPAPKASRDASILADDMDVSLHRPLAKPTTTTTAACHGALLCDAVHQTWTVPSILTKESEIPSAWLGVHSLRRRQVRITEPHFRQHGFLISSAFEYEAGYGSSKRGLAPDRSEPQKCLKGWSECWATEGLRENGAEG